VILGLRVLGDVFADALALDLLEALDEREVDAVLVVDEAVRVGHGDDLRAQLRGLFARVDGDVAGAGDHDGLALEALVRGLEHVVGKVAQAVAGGFGSREAAAVGEALAGQHAGEFVRQALVLAEEEADLAAADADVARGLGGVRAGAP